MSKKHMLTLTGVLSVALLALAACAPSYGSSSSGAAPAAAPTIAQAVAPTSAPTAAPTSAPTAAPAAAPTIAAPSSAPATAPTNAAPAGATVAVQVAQNNKLGKFLADQDGRTLYVFLKDTKNVSNCSGNCATTWPPLKSQVKPTAQNGVDASLLGTIQRQDGSTQVTYNGQPLYYYAPDTAMGDTKGEGVGQVWYVVGPDGSPIKSAANAAPAQAPAQAPAAQPTSPYHY